MIPKVINISKEFEPILYFLYPDYTLVETTSKFSRFIIRKDIKSKNDREVLNFNYEDCIFISAKIFDEVWDQDKIVEEVISFARTRLQSRKRTFKPLNTEGPEFIQECIHFMFTGESFMDSETDINALFQSYGSKVFMREFMVQCKENGTSRTVAAMDTFITKVLSDTESLYYKKAKIRLEGPLGQNIPQTIQEQDFIDPFFKKNFKDLVRLRYYTMLLRKEYYGK